MRLFFLEFLVRCTQFGLDTFLLPQLGLALSLKFLLLGDGSEMARGQFKLLEPQGVVVVGDMQVDHGALLGDLVDDAAQSLLGCFEVAGADTLHAVLRLGVVGAEHDLGHVVDELAALRAGVVEGEVARCGDGLAHLVERLDPRSDGLKFRLQ